MHEIGVAEVVDDDGVLVVGSTRRTRSHCPGSFDEEFPKELLAAMGRGDAVAWMSGLEGDHCVSIELLDGEPPAGSQGPFIIELDEDDEVFVASWGPYSLACGFRGGELERIDGLTAFFTMPAGTYRAWLAAADESPDEDGGIHLRWRVLLTRAPSSAAPASVSSLPTFEGSTRSGW